MTGTNRRGFFKGILQGTAAAAMGATALAAGLKGASAQKTVWQIDPEKCVQCGRCATSCVLAESAVKCVHRYAMCGYCNLCFGFFRPDAKTLTSSAENQVCPTDALKRRFIEDPYFEYTIDEKKCVGCARCVQGCTAFGNGSLYLQIRHDRCVACNQCAIAADCPTQAIARVPASKPYVVKGGEGA